MPVLIDLSSMPLKTMSKILNVEVTSSIVAKKSIRGPDVQCNATFHSASRLERHDAKHHLNHMSTTFVFCTPGTKRRRSVYTGTGGNADAHTKLTPAPVRSSTLSPAPTNSYLRRVSPVLAPFPLDRPFGASHEPRIPFRRTPGGSFGLDERGELSPEPSPRSQPLSARPSSPSRPGPQEVVQGASHPRICVASKPTAVRMSYITPVP